ncbi:E3 ubiquitin-protein ligase AIRP2-like isoform X1 [Primulina eburnea]|uniref:E3 ubiquitin-protein ligase AIRP2-like isoform X1 n=1 Tax=Primulina eburnea TaxID=1245227 RepID=UPI003C6BED75
MENKCCQEPRKSFKESLNDIEADVEHANALAAAIPGAKSGTRLEMKLVYNHMAPLLLHLLEWMECSCLCFSPRYLNLSYILICKVYEDGTPKMSAHARKASINDFYGIILPSLEQLHSDMAKLDGTNADNLVSESTSKKRQDKEGESSSSDPLKDGECGICLVSQAEIVLPDCYHSMCSKCHYRWISRSESCPFCRDNLQGLEPIDLWYLTSKDEIADPATIFAEDLQNFCLYIKNLPKVLPEVMFLKYYEYLI